MCGEGEVPVGVRKERLLVGGCGRGGAFGCVGKGRLLVGVCCVHVTMGGAVWDCVGGTTCNHGCGHW